MTREGDPIGPAAPGEFRFRGPGRGTRFRRATSPFGRGFRRGLGVSLALHGLLLGAFLAGLLGPEPAEPKPRSLHAFFEASVTLEPEPDELPTPPPVPPKPRGAETLLEAVEAGPDLPVAEEPPAAGDPPGALGIPSREGLRRPPSARPRGGGRGEGAKPGAAPEPASEEAPKEPVFVPAKRLPALCAVPAYPRREREKSIEGRVRLRLLVDADGSVKEVSVARSSGSEALDDAALEAVKSWRFEPATEDGNPVASVVLQPLDFRIADDGR